MYIYMRRDDDYYFYLSTPIIFSPNLEYGGWLVNPIKNLLRKLHLLKPIEKPEKIPIAVKFTPEI